MSGAIAAILDRGCTLYPAIPPINVATVTQAILRRRRLPTGGEKQAPLWSAKLAICRKSVCRFRIAEGAVRRQCRLHNLGQWASASQKLVDGARPDDASAGIREAVMDLGSWLRNLGLERFEAAFRDNAIDETVLPHLTEDHLRELGLPLGARIKLLAAIAALSKEADVHSPGPSARVPTDAAERRQITVLFSDLVGSTALSTRMDPEDLRKLISAYQKCVTEIVRRFGGFVAKYMGDGVLAYFGYPEAHEDDAERAVKSGLELVAGVAKLNTHTPLQARVGIATGFGTGRRLQHAVA